MYCNHSHVVLDGFICCPEKVPLSFPQCVSRVEQKTLDFEILGNNMLNGRRGDNCIETKDRVYVYLLLKWVMW